MALLDVYEYECPKCGTLVEVTPTNANRRVFVQCFGPKAKGRRHHAPVAMRLVGQRTRRYP